MREPNLGIYQSCIVCGKRYWCDDGDPFCSGRCYDIAEEENEEE